MEGKRLVVGNRVHQLKEELSSLLNNEKNFFSTRFYNIHLVLFGENQTDSVVVEYERGSKKIQSMSLKRTLELSLFGGDFPKFQLYTSMIRKNIPHFSFFYFLTGTQKTLLHVAVEKGYFNIVKFLIEELQFPVNIRKADFKENKNNGMTALHASLIFNDNLKICRFLIRRGASIHMKYRGVSSKVLMDIFSFCIRHEKLKRGDDTEIAFEEMRKFQTKLEVLKRKKCIFLLNPYCTRIITKRISKNKKKVKMTGKKKYEMKKENEEQIKRKQRILEELKIEKHLFYKEQVRQNNRLLQQIGKIAHHHVEKSLLGIEKKELEHLQALQNLKKDFKERDRLEREEGKEKEAKDKGKEEKEEEEVSIWSSYYNFGLSKLTDFLWGTTTTSTD